MPDLNLMEKYLRKIIEWINAADQTFMEYEKIIKGFVDVVEKINKIESKMEILSKELENQKVLMEETKLKIVELNKIVEKNKIETGKFSFEAENLNRIVSFVDQNEKITQNNEEVKKTDENNNVVSDPHVRENKTFSSRKEKNGNSREKKKE